MNPTRRQTSVAITILVVALGTLVYLLLRPGLTRYVAVDELLDRRATLQGIPLRLAGRFDGEVRPGPDNTLLFRVETRGLSLPVRCSDRVPPGLQPQTAILLDGRLGPDGTFHAHRLLTQCSSRYSDKLKATPGNR